MDSEANRQDDLTYIGRCNFRDNRRVFGIKRRDRRQHVYVVGKTGTGKSTTLLNMAALDIDRGEGVGVIDPHGDLARAVLQLVPSRRINDVIYFNPADQEYPIGFNILESVDRSHPDFLTAKTLVTSGVVGVFKKLWAGSWGPRLEHFLRSTVLALLECPGQTLLGIPRMFTDSAYRERIVRSIRDPIVRTFWTVEFPGYNDQFRSEAVSPIQNKVGQFLSTSLIRNIVGQSNSSFNLREVMDQGKLLVANLSKGEIGEDNSALLGAMLITRIQLAAMERARLPATQRRDFYLYVDEFQNFATESFAAILSESRKYALNLTLAHQYLDQLPETLRQAVLGNVGTTIAFRVGATCAEILEEEYRPTLNRTDLVNLENFSAYIKLTVDGIPRTPFSMRTLTPRSSESGGSNMQKIIRQSHARYGTKRSTVEERYSRWASSKLA